jgi:hypothetical protein
MDKPAFLIGQLGGDYLLEQLSSSNQPFKVIEQFQHLAGLRQTEDKYFSLNSCRSFSNFVLSNF